MEDLDDVYAKIQLFLMKKDQECGKLRFLTSRTTVENSDHIEDVCKKIGEILGSSKIPVEEETSKSDKRCIQAFKYLMLNTFLECQEHLAEDLVNGHLVDMCPPLSAYLLTEILWSLKFESIVAESLLYMPLDLCVEILAISRRCVSLLDFERSLDFVSASTLNCYKKMIIVDKKGVQSINLDESLELLTIHFQELMALFSDEKFLRLEEVANLRKSERSGLILRKILELVKNCLKSGSEGVELSPEMETIYKITFGRKSAEKSRDDLANHLRMLDQELAHLLLKKLKEIDCNTYIDWASLESRGNSAVSLQRSIGNDCYDLIDFIKGTDRFLHQDHLIECLQQLSAKPDEKTSFSDLDLRKLSGEAATGNKEAIKELINRYREWDHETFEVIQGTKSLIDKDDFLNLLEYLTLVMTKSGQEDHKRRVYATITRIFMQLEIPDLYETILDYILKHDGRNTLESARTEEAFQNFMAHNRNFRSPQNLRVVLFFLLKNPRKILSILVKIAIGDPRFSSFMVSPADLALLSPVMNIRDEKNETLIVSTYRAVCLENFEWNPKKFAHFAQVLLEERIINSDKMVNDVFVPFLNAEHFGTTNLVCVLNCLRKFASLCTREIHAINLLEALGKRMSIVRSDISVSKYSGNEILALISRVIEIFLRKLQEVEPEAVKFEIERIEVSLQPIDKHHFSRILSTNLFPRIDVFHAIRDYDRRIFVALNRIKTEVDDEEDLDDLSRFYEHFFRHLFVKATEKEYVKFATEATIIHWKSFRWEDEYEAFDKIVKITFEACVYFLEFPHLNSPDAFAFLVKSLARFARNIANLEEVRNSDKLYESLADNVRALDKWVKNSVFSGHFVPVILAINNRANHEPISESLQQLTQSIDDFGNKCLEITRNEAQFDRSHSPEAARFRIAYEFVEECLAGSDDKSYQSLCRIYKLLGSDDSSVL